MANGRGGRGLGQSKKIQLFQRNTVGFNLEMNLVSGVKKLEAAVREKVLRSATFAGINLFYTEMRLRVPVSEGTLYSAIYQYHVDDRSTKFRQVYATGPNKAKAGHWHWIEYGHWRYNKIINGKAQRSKSNTSRSNRVTPPGSAHRGVHDLPGALDVPVWVPAKPYIRPTYDAKIGQLLATFNKRAGERLSEVLRTEGKQ